jgi:hypothetical protein
MALLGLLFIMMIIDKFAILEDFNARTLFYQDIAGVPNPDKGVV